MKYLKIFTNFREITAALSDGAMGRLFRAMLLYAEDGTETPFKGKEAVAWAVAKQQIDRDAEAYGAKVKYLRRGNGPVSENTAPVTGKEKEKETEKEKEKDSLSAGGAGAPEERERIPTLEEVMAYSQETGITADVEYFYNYYAAKGWRIGNFPMRDWKAALKAWARKETATHGPAKEPSVGDNFRIAMEMMRQREAKQV